MSELGCFIYEWVQPSGEQKGIIVFASAVKVAGRKFCKITGLHPDDPVTNQSFVDRDNVHRGSLLFHYGVSADLAIEVRGRMPVAMRL